MAQPQGLNVPAIITTGIVTVILTAVIVEGVRALYLYEEPIVEAQKWNNIHERTVTNLRLEQTKNLELSTSPIEASMAKVAATGGKMPSTQPNG